MKKPIQFKLMKKSLYSSILFLFCAVLCLSCSASEEKKEKEDSRGESIVETGEIAAINTKSFVMPRVGRYWYEMRVIGILDHGTIVEEGDSIIQLDATEIKKFIIDRETSLENEQASLEKMKVDHENTLNDMESRIKNEIASFNLKKIEVESARFESERYRKIKGLEFEQAKINLAKEKKKMELNKIIIRNNMKIQQIRIQQIESEVKNGYDILPQLTLRTPISGVFQIAHNRRTNTLVKVGDNIYTGNNLANVPELKIMKVNTQINENDFLKIKSGDKVAVRLDALPKVVFDGEIAYIGKLCHLKDSKSRQKVFDVEVRMLKHDERLKPGMTVSCEFLRDK